MTAVVKDVYKKLFTREDNLNIHKTLGLSCLVSFVYRFSKVGPSDMGYTSGKGTLGTIVLHLSLSLTSLIFRIPAKRIASGYRIWPEYRLHSIVFACRSLSAMLLYWVEAQNQWAPMYPANACIVLLTIVAADVSSWSAGSNHSSSIQDLDAGPVTKYFFSVMQFHATMGVMLGVRRYSLQFIYVWIVQLNAFLMTLRRKNLGGHSVLVTVYGCMLLFGLMVASYEMSRVGAFLMVTSIGNTAACLRLGVRMPKYLLWTLMAVVTHFSRIDVGLLRLSESPRLDVGTHVPWAAVFAASMVALVAVGARKVSRANAAAAKLQAANGHANGNGHAHDE